MIEERFAQFDIKQVKGGLSLTDYEHFLKEYKSRPTNVHYHEVSIKLHGEVYDGWQLRNDNQGIENDWPVTKASMRVCLSSIGVVNNNGFVVCKSIKRNCFKDAKESDKELISTINDFYGTDPEKPRTTFHRDMCHVSHMSGSLKIMSVGIAYKTRSGCRELLLNSKETQDEVLDGNSKLEELFSEEQMEMAKINSTGTSAQSYRIKRMS